MYCLGQTRDVSSSRPAWLAATHILASHPAAGHLEVELAVVLRVKRILGAGVEQRTHGLVTFKHQIDVACKANAALQDSFNSEGTAAVFHNGEKEYETNCSPNES